MSWPVNADRERLKELNKLAKTRKLTQQEYDERKEVQAKLRAQGFYDKQKRGPEREDSEAESTIERMLSRY